MLFRVKTPIIAHTLIDHFGSLSAVLDASPEDLMQINGIGENSAQFLNMLPDIFKAYRKSKMEKRIPLTSLALATNYFNAYLQNLPREEFYVACLDSELMLIKNVLISQGTVNNANIEISDITRAALKFNSSAVILAHNHPSGKCIPSPEDYQITQNIVVSLGLNGINTLDHLIIGKDRAYSFEGENKITEFRSSIEKISGIQLVSASKVKYTTDNYIKV